MSLLNDLSIRASSTGVRLDFDDSAKDLIIREGYDPDLGARPLRRAIIKLVEDRFSESILMGEISAGDSIRVLAKGGEMVFVKKA